MKQMHQFDTNINERAVFAYFRDRYKHRRAQHPAVWPDYQKSGVFVYNGREYMILRGPANQLLAVFRIRPSNDTLRRLHLYPPALEHPPESQQFYRRKKEKVEESA